MSDEVAVDVAIRHESQRRAADAGTRDLVEALGRRSHRRGAAKLRRIIAEGPAPTRSLLEDVVLDLTEAVGLEQPDVDVPIDLDGRRVLPGFRWPRRRLVIEA
jgi:hypothetical protein